MGTVRGEHGSQRRPGAQGRQAAGGVPGSPWQEQLFAQREVLNSRLAAARSAGAPVESLRAALVELGPAADHLARSTPSPDDFARTVLPLVDAVARLVAGGAWHEASVERWALLGVVPFVPRALSRSPEVTIDVVVQGAARTARGTDLDAWGRRLASADPHLSDDDAFRRAAAVAAWRSGFVRVRQAALAAAERLPDTALTALLDLSAGPGDRTSDPHGAGPTAGVRTGRPTADQPTTDLREVLARTAADPFWWPGAPAAGRVARVGGFRGSAGPWVGVPVVLGPLDVPTPTWRVWADDQPWVVLADAHGTAVLRDHAGRASSSPPEAGSPAADLVTAVSRHLGSADRVTGASAAWSARSSSAAAAGSTRASARTASSTGPETSATPVPAAVPFPAPVPVPLTVLVSQQTSYRLDVVRLDGSAP